MCILNRPTGKISNILFALFTPITLSTNLKHKTRAYPSLVELLDLIQVVSPLPCGQCCPLHGLSASSYHNPARNTTWCDPVRNIGHLPRRPVCKKQRYQRKWLRIPWILEPKFPIIPHFLFEPLIKISMKVHYKVYIIKLQGNALLPQHEVLGSHYNRIRVRIGEPTDAPYKTVRARAYSSSAMIWAPNRFHSTLVALLLILVLL